MTAASPQTDHSPSRAAAQGPSVAEGPSVAQGPAAAAPAGFGRTALVAYLALAFAALSWGGNGVAGRLAVDEIPPLTLVCLRWVGVVVLLALFARREIAQAAPALLAAWRYTLAMGALGFTAFNALFYAAAHYTGAVNLTFFQGAMPALVMLGARVIYGDRVGPLQALGLVLAVVGVGLVASQGSLERLLALDLNLGDAFMLVADLLYAGYTLGLRRRPNVGDIGLFAGLAAGAFVTSLPLVAYEAWRGEAFLPSAYGWLVLAYIALFPSLLAQLAFMRGVALLGPARAGPFVNLVPIFGALLAVTVLGEPFHLYHGVALALVLGGIALAEAGRR